MATLPNTICNNISITDSAKNVEGSCVAVHPHSNNKTTASKSRNGSAAYSNGINDCDMTLSNNHICTITPLPVQQLQINQNYILNQVNHQNLSSTFRFQNVTDQIAYQNFSDHRIFHYTPFTAANNIGLINCNRNFLRRSRSTSNVRNKERQLNWALRSWKYTTLGYKLMNKNSLKYTFTIMSYNVLAQNLLNEHSYLYKKHIPAALLWKQRWKTLYEEIKKHNADILCLQEVQRSHIDDYFNQLKALGYDSLYKQRTGFRCDGCAIYYKSSKFDLVEHNTIEFNQKNVYLLDRDNVAIIAKFAPKHTNRSEFIVATTHLLYNPRREDVRLAQTQVLLSEVDRIAFTKNVNGNPQYLPIIITGDFNLTPESAVYSLITDGTLKYENLTKRKLSNKSNSEATGKLFLPPSLKITDHCQHADLVKQRNENTKLNQEEELRLINHQHSCSNNNQMYNHRSHFSTGTLSHGLLLKSAYDHQTKYDYEATTFQDEWVTVDYIFYSGKKNEKNFHRDDKLKLISRYTLPTTKQLAGLNIPNFVMGSDHISLLVMFQLDP